jgi:hypothetical protein
MSPQRIHRPSVESVQRHYISEQSALRWFTEIPHRRRIVHPVDMYCDDIMRLGPEYYLIFDSAPSRDLWLAVDDPSHSAPRNERHYQAAPSHDTFCVRAALQSLRDFDFLCELAVVIMGLIT